MGSHHFGKIVKPFESVVNLPKRVRIGPDGEVIEGDAFNALGLRRERNNT